MRLMWAEQGPLLAPFGGLGRNSLAGLSSLVSLLAAAGLLLAFFDAVFMAGVFGD
jgi:hypothetical protein